MRSPGRLIALALGALSLLAPPPTARAATEAEVDAIGAQLLCYCGCARRDLAECTCSTADQEREQIGQQLDGGSTPQEIIDGYVARYGEQILIVPPKRGFNLVAWVAPFAGLAVLGVLFVILIRRWERTPALAPAAPMAPVEGSPDDAELREQLRRELEQFRS